MINEVKLGQAAQVQAQQAEKAPRQISRAEVVATQAQKNAQEAKRVQIDGDKVEFGAKSFAPPPTYGRKLTPEQVQTLKSRSERAYSHLSGLVDQMLGEQVKRTGRKRRPADLTSEVLGATRTEQTDFFNDKEWGVEAVSDRIVDFAKNLADGDMSKFEKLKGAIEKGFGMARKSLGGKLPDISQATYAATMKKLDAWKNGTGAKTGTEKTE